MPYSAASRVGASAATRITPGPGHARVMTG
jgi:hypothetical protein